MERMAVAVGFRGVAWHTPANLSEVGLNQNLSEVPGFVQGLS